MAISSAVLWDSIHDDVCRSLPGFDGSVVQTSGRPAFDFISRPDTTFRQFAAAALLRSIVKKFQDEIDQDEADRAAESAFNDAERANEVWQLRNDQLGPYDSMLIGEFKKTLYDFFTVEGDSLLSMAAIEQHVDFGPGSSPGVDDESFITKIGHCQLTAEGQILVDWFYNWVRNSEARIDAEIGRMLSFGPAIVEKGCKISLVPKTAKISRLVKSEMPLNMFFQKGIQAVLVQRLHSFFGVDLSTQPRFNAELARRGSLPGGSYCTIDLKGASDYMSREMCKTFIPASSFQWMDITRGKTIKSEVKDCGYLNVTYNPLYMMCTMGNAFCFPLQTAIFASVVIASYKCLGLPIRYNRNTTELVSCPADGSYHLAIQTAKEIGNFGVFGDDIIVVEEAYPTVLRLLRALGFIPNMDKTFSAETGNFRESCGSDFFFGYPVRGVYCKSLKTMQDRYALINSLVDWSAQHDISLAGTIRLLTDSVERVEVPPWENPDSGIRMPLSCVCTSDVYISVARKPAAVKLGACSSLEQPRLREMTRWAPPSVTGSYLYKRYVPIADKVDVSTQAAFEKTKYLNYGALFLSAVKGACRGGFVGYRSKRGHTNYKARYGVAPSWDYAVPGSVPAVNWNAWKQVCEGVLIQER
ncbi:RNA-directed RNA polymerase [ssRNA phage SRR5466364_1]|uniref:RNA-directed RNA polymerase n=1 Tax=ssRNA phage SRR5466364_1 TaxID=2786395 RepID=A0A8S5KYE6_9VIRU|nr:RNA-directed RNA polymerase [ssRNA phage SRR5466364_1]DAD50798.1 TPA_asm: RNA-directed RNA polymerase [ssRNA phage SRR5466364_1]